MSNSDIEVCISFGETDKIYKYMPAIPKTGDTIKIESKQYKVIEVVWNVDIEYGVGVDVYTEPKD